MENTTKTRILEQALVSFATNGYKGTNLRDFAAQLGLTKSALYRHFDSKEAIWDAVLDKMESYYCERFGSADKMPAAPKSCGELAALTMHMLDFTIHDPKVILTRRLLLTEQFHDARARKFASLHFLTGTKEIFTKLFAAMMEDGILKKDDPEILAFAYTAPITALVHLCDREPEKEQEILRKIEKFVRHFLRTYEAEADNPVPRHPWEEISLSDYENHMRLDCVRQLQAMNELMRKQLSAYPTSTAMILGIAGGNGLEHVEREKYRKVYGIDINEAYLAATKERYPALEGVLECRRLDLCGESDRLPQAELVIANLVIEYIGYAAFQKCVLRSGAHYVSCVIQINEEDAWVSDSPYLAAFDGLDAIHHTIEESELIAAMEGIGYCLHGTDECPMPNGKKLVLLDFTHEEKQCEKCDAGIAAVSHNDALRGKTHRENH